MMLFLEGPGTSPTIVLIIVPFINIQSMAKFMVLISEDSLQGKSCSSLFNSLDDQSSILRVKTLFINKLI